MTLVVPRTLFERLNPKRLRVYVGHAEKILGPLASAGAVEELARAMVADHYRAQIGGLIRLAIPTWFRRWMPKVGLDQSIYLTEAVNHYGRALVILPHTTWMRDAARELPYLLPPQTKATTVVSRHPLWWLYRFIRRIGRWLDHHSDQPLTEMVGQTDSQLLVRELVHRLKSATPAGWRQILISAGDRADLDHEVTRVEFFGQTIKFGSGLIRLAQLTGTPIVPAGVWRTPDGIVVRCCPAIIPEQTRNLSETRRLTQLVARQFEQMLRENPQQWSLNRTDFWE